MGNLSLGALVITGAFDKWDHINAWYEYCLELLRNEPVAFHPGQPPYIKPHLDTWPADMTARILAAQAALWDGLRAVQEVLLFSQVPEQPPCLRDALWHPIRQEGPVVPIGGIPHA